MSKVIGVMSFKGGASLRENAFAKDTPSAIERLRLKRRFATDDLGNLGSFYE